jgi:hypothetical protein
MTVGTQTNVSSVNQNLSQDARDLRDLANRILARQAYMNKLGTAGLQGIGFSAADAQAVLDHVNHMVTPMQVYKGTATQAATFNFEDSLTDLWSGM